MSLNIVLPKPVAFKGTSYRNIYTIKESQNLFDDLVADQGSVPVLQVWDNESSGIDHSAPQKNRPFQYAEVATIDALINPGKWGQSRFSDGTFGVWYGALEENTSTHEALYHAYRFAKEDFASEHFPVVVERKMFAAQIEAGRVVDLRKFEPQEDLVSNDYGFCQELGKTACREPYDMYFAPSARRAGGVCTPVFNAKSIIKDRALYFLKFSFLSPDEVRITRDLDEVTPIPPGWK